ncbi:sorbitol dehydrogenase [Jimgerdemannia flammicorona]|uniref:Sorbitol dehydrogenase n=1 Tax=Jimgerdemannia flammicorona TaxID=994334 RepID=A0A433P8Z8_9FUNG|nr:sorbitol dehydrogenase [Jimgerdemannia flammicorona]
MSTDSRNYAVLLTKKDDLQIVEIPMPEPAHGEVQLQTKATGICGSDVHMWKHGQIGIFEVKNPVILGHESMGVVTKLGEGIKTLKVGDRVAIEPGIPCSACEQCLGGRYNLCPDLVFKSTPPYHGVLANYITHPERWLYKYVRTHASSSHLVHS